MNVNTARQTSGRADKTILLYIIVGVNQLSCEPETLNIIKLLYILRVVYKLFGETNQLTLRFAVTARFSCQRCLKPLV